VSASFVRKNFSSLINFLSRDWHRKYSF